MSLLCSALPQQLRANPQVRRNPQVRHPQCWSADWQGKTEKEKVIKEKEIMQKKMDEMQAQLELAHSKVGDVVSVESPITPSACKVRLKLV